MWGSMGWGPLMPIIWLAVLGLIAWAVVSVVRGPSRNLLGGSSGGRSNAIEVLKERYARGDISREEYERMRKELG